MKIALLSGYASPSAGYGTITSNYCEQLYQRGIDFTLFLPRDHEAVSAPWADRVQYGLTRVALEYGRPKSLLNYTATLDPFRGHDIVHSLFALPHAAIAYRAARRWNTPFIMGAQGTYGVYPFLSLVGRRLFQRILDHADRIIVPSEFTANAMLAFYDRHGLANRFRIIHNGVDYPRFSSATRSPGAGGASFEFIGVGGLKPRKGFHITIAAMKRVVARYPEARYAIAGSGAGPYVQKLHALVNDLGLADHIRFLGHVDNEALPEVMRGHNAYAHTPICSDWNFEGFGIVYLEANAAGLPAIGARSGGVPDAIRHGETGLLCRERNVEDTARQMIHLIERPDLYESIQKNAVSWAEEHDWSRIIEYYLGEYHAVLNGD